MEILEFINNKVWQKYAKWIAMEDMIKVGVDTNLLKIDNNMLNKEKTHEKHTNEQCLIHRCITLDWL